MKKQIILTIILALVAMTGKAIDERQSQGGTAVLKGRILNKPESEWNIISVRASDLFTQKELVFAIPVAADGTFEGSITLPHSQSVYIDDLGEVFLAVGDTVEVTKDAAQYDYEGVTFGGHGTGADINRLWPEVRQHYFGDRQLFVKGMAREDVPQWKQDMVKLMDTVIADIEADRLSLPAGTNAYVKEVMGASLLGELLMAVIDNYRYNMTEGDNMFNIKITELGDYYDFLAGREKWLLDNPAMLFVMKSPDVFFSCVWAYIMLDITFMPKDPQLTPAGYFQKASSVIISRYGLQHVGFMQQMVLCRDVLDEDRIDPNSDPDEAAARFAAIIPLITHPVVANHALDRYRQYVKQREGRATASTSANPEADAIFQRIIEPYKGNALYVDFWDMSCGPCRAEMLQDREKVEQLKDKPVRFLYICDEKTSPRERTEKWLTENNIKGEHIYVSHEEWLLLSAKFQFNATPFNIGVDKDGNIVTRQAVSEYVQEMLK